jgi:uncharacterized protein YjiS (DUF1127 family)
MMKMDRIKELVEMIDTDIKALESLDDVEALESAGLEQKEAESLILKHFKNAVLALLLESMRIGAKGDDEK